MANLAIIMKHKYKMLAILIVIILISYCNYSSKPTPTLGETYFDIPLLMDKNIDEAIKSIGFFTDFYENKELSTLHIENNGWLLEISFDYFSRKINGISLRQNFKNYDVIEFNNENINDFFWVGNLDKTSKAYDLTLYEPSDPFPGIEPEEHHTTDKFNNIISLNVVRKTPTIIYDISNLIGKKIDYVRLQLGKNLKSIKEDKMDTEGYITYKKDGYTLIVNFNTLNKIISSFKIVSDDGGFENPKDMLTVGNLNSANATYLCVVGNMDNKYNIVSIYPN